MHSLRLLRLGIAACAICIALAMVRPVGGPHSVWPDVRMPDMPVAVRPGHLAPQDKLAYDAWVIEHRGGWDA